jgi:ubiquinone/menaquinone biosynthesis C-methylase UbiE
MENGTIDTRAISERPTSKNYFSELGHLFDYSDRTQAFLEQVHFEIDQAPDGITVLDVGCGHGIALSSDPQFQIGERVGVYWGVEPDREVVPPDCFDRVWMTSLEDAEIPEASVDLAYSQMVLEHVLDPEPFLRKIERILKPGGVFVSLTVNADSTFARMASTCHRLGIQELALRIARGKQMVEEYHYPAVYRMCNERSLRTLITKCNLQGLKLGYLEADEWLVYFPRGTRWMGKILTRIFQRRVKNYSWLMVRIEK